MTGLGIYSASAAARLIGVRRSALQRWICLGSKPAPSHLWVSSALCDDDDAFLDFHDLIEARVIAALVAAGFSQTGLGAVFEANRHFGGPERPLSTTWFSRYGRTILDAIPPRNQLRFELTVRNALKGVEYCSEGLPRLWFPISPNDLIVLDPARSHGQPIDTVSGVPTALLAEASCDHGNELAARIYGVSMDVVERATAFEAWLDEGAILKR